MPSKKSVKVKRQYNHPRSRTEDEQDEIDGVLFAFKDVLNDARDSIYMVFQEGVKAHRAGATWREIGEIMGVDAATAQNRITRGSNYWMGKET